jgi:predicted DNA-binding transcriptional regulator YafY
MSRSDRLAQLAGVLRESGDTTVAALAARLEVSRRTVLRDLGALRERGLTIAGEPGPGGGIRLEGDRGTMAVHFSLDEIVAMWLAARLAQAASNLPWQQAATSGLAKLFASIPAAKSRALRALSRRVIVGSAASAAVRAGAGVPPSELLRLFEEAFSDGIGLGFQYTDSSGRTSARRAEPHGLLVEPPVWYVLARDVDKNVPRTFRMDRIARPRLLREITFRPDVLVIRAQLPESDRWRPLSGSWTT